VESVKHFLLECPFYVRERHALQQKLRHNAGSLSFFLSSPVTVLPLLKFVHATGRFKTFFGKDTTDKIQTNACRNAKLCNALERLEAFIRNPANHPQNQT
jgi:hypothetical protein